MNEFKPRRLAGFDYVGRYPYHLVAVVSERKRFLVGRFADEVIADLHRAADATHVELLTFVVMPDHVHLLVLGAADDANAIKFMQRFQQFTGYRFKRSQDSELWQHSFFDRIIRRDEDLLTVARYMLDNPVRSGLVGDQEDWPYSGGTLLAGTEAPDPQAPAGGDIAGAEAPPLRGWAAAGGGGAEAPPLRERAAAGGGGAEAPSTRKHAVAAPADGANLGEAHDD